MFAIEIQEEFTAVHAVALPGLGPEPPHSHRWRLRVFLTRGRLDDYGMVADFHQIKKYLREILAPLENTDLNLTLALGCPPTAERIARYLFDRLAARVAPSGTTVQSVALCETEGCWAWYTP